jgi:hypothetical protein
VLRAWKHYITFENQQRPFFLAGHSQGSCHGMRLLLEEIQGSSCDRLVCAYLVGYRLPVDVFARCDGLAGGRGAMVAPIRPSSAPGDIRCVVGWDTALEGVQVQRVMQSALAPGHMYPGGWESAEGKPKMITNPLTWQTPLPPNMQEQIQVEASAVANDDGGTDRGGNGGSSSSSSADVSGSADATTDRNGLCTCSEGSSGDTCQACNQQTTSSSSNHGSTTSPSPYLGCIGHVPNLSFGVPVPGQLKPPISLGADFVSRVVPSLSWQGGDDYLHVPNPQHLLPVEMRGGLAYQPESNGRLHTSDYGLFYFNIRANVELQTKHWLASKSYDHIGAQISPLHQITSASQLSMRVQAQGAQAPVR